MAKTVDLVVAFDEDDVTKVLVTSIAHLLRSMADLRQSWTDHDLYTLAATFEDALYGRTES